VADELDLAPDLLVLDYGLGTIGLVHVLQSAESGALAEQAKRHVDQATYLRHLLATRGVTTIGTDFPLDYTVECVLAIQLESAPQLIDVVRDIAAKTRFLHATGLNLLQFGADSQIPPAELHRAFAWLLPATRERLLAGYCPLSFMREVELFNYRVRGARPWKLNTNRVHMLHGPNGTGKSSIAEALELAVTGAVDRIKSNPNANYAGIIRNSESTGSATIQISMSDGRTLSFTVNATGVAETAMQPSLAASAFRLDQTVMDQLIRGDSQQRARIFTKSFFPGDAYRDLELAQEEFNKSYRELPIEIRNAIQLAKTDPNDWPAALVQRLEWIDEPSAPADKIADCLPLKKEHLETLGRIVPEIGNSLLSLQTQLARTAFEANLKLLDEALGRVRANARRYWDAVVHSVKALETLATWMPASGEVQMVYPELLERWTERLALGDLLKKHLEVSKSLADARSKGWKPNDSNPAGLLALPADTLQQSVAGLTQAAGQCAREQDEFFKQLLNSSPATAAAGGAQTHAGLSTGEIADLNLVSAWLGAQEATPPNDLFGDVVEKAISENTTIVFGTHTIGSQEWTKWPTDFLSPLQPALEELLAFDQTPGTAVPASATAGSTEPRVYRSPLVRLHAYSTALAAARKVAAAYRKVEETLMNRLTERKLNEALDEVIALFTPARWAYEGLSMNPNLREGKVSVELVTKTGSQADMRLNTAELNLIVLALYLLCGPTVDNPLGTVVLDDPLQNMDELTSATVARGVSKVAALLPEGWQLLLMFHGEEAVEIFRREVPGSVYRLPWLGPIGAGNGDGNGVRADASRTRNAQDSSLLCEVMEARIERRRTSRRLPDTQQTNYAT
jgi:hypothetical protein